MPFSIAQAGTSLVQVATDGTFVTLTLPTEVTLSSTLRPRFAILGRVVYMVNSPTINLAIDPDATVRFMCPLPPASAGRNAAGSSTGLTGAYITWYTNKIKDAKGNLVAESPRSPAGNSITLTSQNLSATFAPVSTQSGVNSRGVYRSTASGTIAFHLFDLDDNTVASWADGLSDAGLSLLAESGSLGSPPGSAPGTRMELIVSWKDRLWGKGADISQVDHVLYSENRKGYAWPAANDLSIPPVGQDAEGITAFVKRRNELGVARRNSFYKIIPTASSFEVMNVIEGKGLIAPDSVVVVNDIGYGLGLDGVYEWSVGGFRSVSNGKVRSWFTTDTYFNRSRFDRAFGGYNPATNSYELHLAAAASSSEDRWISYCLTNQQWYGPHQTAAFTPTARVLARDSNGIETPYIGASNGFLHTANSATRTDGPSSAIDMDIRLLLHANTPDIEKMFGQPSILTNIEASGSLTVTPTIGGMGATAESTLTHDLTLGREVLGYLANHSGRILRLTLQQNTNAVDTRIYGIEIPYFEWGKQ